VFAIFKLSGNLGDQLVALPDLSLQVLHLMPQFAQQHPQCAGQLVVGIFQDPSQALFDMTTPFTDSDASLEQHPSDLVDHRGPAHYPPLAHPVQRVDDLS
jgi:hypothetical protein